MIHLINKNRTGTACGLLLIDSVAASEKLRVVTCEKCQLADEFADADDAPVDDKM